MRITNRCVAVAAVVGATALTTSVPAMAADNNRPRTEPVAGTFSASPVKVKQRTCVGQDGPYLELRGTWEGKISSSDPRLTGELEFMAEPALVNTTTGFGTFQGRFAISDEETGKQKTEGKFYTVITEGALNHGFAVANAINQGNGPAQDFFTEFNTTLDSSLNAAGEFGGTGDPRTPGVIQGGHCEGPFTVIP
jgi:hypothetical protein